VETQLCAAVGTSSHQHGLEAYGVCGDPTVCSCRYSKPSECTQRGGFRNMLGNDKAVKEIICGQLAFIYLRSSACLYELEDLTERLHIPTHADDNDDTST
jgi:hypothetical protein